ncbi:putative Proteasome subunit alpha type-5 [Cocos nucifera]|uniref:Putative Proteasome subunit alpha type-5 n=1 Tax=Cocos nucifera TaxID=13894 RepID=A0A8K0IHC3_COCNU|nr:putative Proteasome subunit alpha type-5 [Cocos nucifera]
MIGGGKAVSGQIRNRIDQVGVNCDRLKTNEGVVLAVEKRVTSPLLEPSSVEKIMEIDEHIGCALSGLIADACTLVENARVETQNHRFSYGKPMSVESTAQAPCDLALRFGEGDEESMGEESIRIMFRNATSVYHAVWEENVCLFFWIAVMHGGQPKFGMRVGSDSVYSLFSHANQRYYTDPSGTFWQCDAKAIGSGSEGADSSLQEQYNREHYCLVIYVCYCLF